MLQLVRERLTLVLLALLPFHALGVTFLTKLLAGPDQAPLAALAVWKEALLAVILLIALVEIVRLRAYRPFDLLDGLILAFAAVAILVSILNGVEQGPLLLGIRYDLVPLGAFVLLRRVPWTQRFPNLAAAVLMGAGAVVGGVALMSFFAPAALFRWLGYSDLHSLYVPGGPIAPFQLIGDSMIRRVQGPMSGPNQLGIWLLLPLSLLLLQLFYKRTSASIAMAVLIGAGILLSFSRSAWIAAVVVIVASLPKAAWKAKVVVPVACVLCCLAAVLLIAAPSVLLRAASSAGHIEKPVAAMREMLVHPLGLGLGTAGPASNRSSDACVFLEEWADAAWASSHPELCVFAGEKQIQPTDRTCQCPFLTENWYLQIGVEAGFLGMALFVLLILALFKSLTRYPVVSLMLIGVSVAALFLHAWEDAAVSYTVWIFAAVCLALRPRGAVGAGS